MVEAVGKALLSAQMLTISIHEVIVAKEQAALLRLAHALSRFHH